MGSFSWDDYTGVAEHASNAAGRSWTAHSPTHGFVVIQQLELTQEQVDQLSLHAAEQLSVADPNVVPVLEVDPAQRIIVREAVHGVTLRDYLTTHFKLAPTQASAVLGQVAAGWAAVQNAGLLVGNLRPENIVINLSVVPNQLRIGEFAMPDESGAQLPLAYLAPELIRGEQPTQASDAYAFGATWYELLTGETPGAELSPIDRLSFTPQRPHGVSSEIWEVLAPLLSLDPDARPTNAADLSQRLFGLLVPGRTPAPTPVVEASTEERAIVPSWIRENTFIAVLIAVAVALIFIIVLVVMMLNGINRVGQDILGGQTLTPTAIETSATMAESPTPTTEPTDTPAPTETSQTPSPTPPPTLPPGARACTPTVGVNGSTSCEFAANVAAAFEQNGPGTFDVTSPVTGQSYSMTCTTDGRLTTCQGGNGAKVFIVS